MNLRNKAKGQRCMVRIPMWCNFDPTTTCLAHERQSGITGGGQKAPDLLGAWACHACHGIVDGQIKTDLDPDYIRLCFLDGVMRTQYALIREGVIQW